MGQINNLYKLDSQSKRINSAYLYTKIYTAHSVCDLIVIAVSSINLIYMPLPSMPQKDSKPLADANLKALSELVLRLAAVLIDPKSETINQ